MLIVFSFSQFPSCTYTLVQSLSLPSLSPFFLFFLLLRLIPFLHPSPPPPPASLMHRAKPRQFLPAMPTSRCSLVYLRFYTLLLNGEGVKGSFYPSIRPSGAEPARHRGRHAPRLSSCSWPPGSGHILGHRSHVGASWHNSMLASVGSTCYDGRARSYSPREGIVAIFTSDSILPKSLSIQPSDILQESHSREDPSRSKESKRRQTQPGATTCPRVGE